MAETSRYCKAYMLNQLRTFPGWKENADGVRVETREEEGEEQEYQRQLTDEDFLYVHDNYVVTDGIFNDENIIFDDVTEKWMTFCQEELEFAVPDYLQDEESSDTGAEVTASAAPANG